MYLQICLKFHHNLSILWNLYFMTILLWGSCLNLKIQVSFRDLLKLEIFFDFSNDLVKIFWISYAFFIYRAAKFLTLIGPFRAEKFKCFFGPGRAETGSGRAGPRDLGPCAALRHRHWKIWLRSTYWFWSPNQRQNPATKPFNGNFIS